MHGHFTTLKLIHAITVSNCHILCMGILQHNLHSYHAINKCATHLNAMLIIHVHPLFAFLNTYDEKEGSIS